MTISRSPLNSLSHSKQRFLVLLCLILGLMVLVPIIHRFFAVKILIDIFLTAIVISMVYTVSDKKGHVIIGLVLAIVMVTFLWLQHFQPNKWIAAISMLAGALFGAVVIISLLGFMLRSDDVNFEIISAAILVYLVAAIMWAFTYSLLELLDPASFNVELKRPEGYLLLFQYYSFVTITTLGYGDITPVSDVAKAFSILEAVVGQLYLVVVVAWLVGMHVSSRSRSSIQKG